MARIACIDLPRGKRIEIGLTYIYGIGRKRSGDILTFVVGPSERALIDRLQTVMAVIEGHAEHVMDAVGVELLPSLPKLRAAMQERRRSGSPLARLLSRLLGIELKLRQ